MTWIVTRSGVEVSLLEPRAVDILIEDIAWGISHLCRFVGHTPRFYSVAEHSVRVSRLVPKEHRFAALLHDAHEAYIGDISSPLKVAIYGMAPQVALIDRDWHAAIEKRFELEQGATKSEEVHLADMVMLAVEKKEFFGHMDLKRQWIDMPPPDPDVKIKYWSPNKAYNKFLDTYYDLFMRHIR